ncbi:YqaJ-like recombinase protein [Paraburkholderia silvatlantica]|uniref:YqaJ-like recombinase protein n=1 Tax=Paraburkholderia silvatlantica TaxID=321895 RepID=A0A2V4SY32_9BURK|nr:lambda exonuclease family protein [Paraburkholderia silvatlantica]PYE13392.1 YqaJ-like recombinase protein [Paraburkholderia silvatlantica]
MRDDLIICSHEQGTPEWLADRAGRATGSRAKDILAKIKSGEAAARRNYRTQLVTERLTGKPQESGFVSKEMQWGTEQEPFARMAYESETGNLVSEFGFIYMPDLMAGCSVDGIIEENGRVGVFEAKCPVSATHVEYLTAGKLPAEYKPQILHNVYVTGADFADFVSFDPRMPGKLQLFKVRWERDDEEIAEYAVELKLFLSEVDVLHKRLSELAA